MKLESLAGLNCTKDRSSIEKVQLQNPNTDYLPSPRFITALVGLYVDMFVES